VVTAVEPAADLPQNSSGFVPFPANDRRVETFSMHTALLATEFVDFLSSNFLWIMGGTIGLAAVLTSGLKEIIRIRSRERTRREIAAYIAEGAMTPEQGERLMRAGSSSSEV
jgi:hypothetical protein